MTTCLVVRKGPEAVIGADTLTTYGDGKEPAGLLVHPSKIVRVGDSFLAATGPGSIQLILRDYFGQPNAPCDLSTPDTIFTTMHSFQRALVDRYALSMGDVEEDPFEALPCELLIANPQGIFGVYPLRSVQAYTQFYAMGSGAPYALGAMQVAYSNRANAEGIARAGLEAAARFDLATGSPFTISRVQLSAEPDWETEHGSLALGPGPKPHGRANPASVAEPFGAGG